MLQDYEDWRAETPTIILDIPGIQAKEHPTDKALRSLTLELEVLRVSYPSTTWARAYTDGAKNGKGGVFIKLPDKQIHQEVCGYSAAVNKLQSWSVHLAHSSPDPEPGR